MGCKSSKTKREKEQKSHEEGTSSPDLPNNSPTNDYSSDIFNSKINKKGTGVNAVAASDWDIVDNARRAPSVGEKKDSIREQIPLKNTNSFKTDQLNGHQANGSLKVITTNKQPFYMDETIGTGEASSTGSQTPPVYRLRGPRGFAATQGVFPCFKAGMLYRIVDGDKWVYYNDTQEYEMQVEVQFGPKSKIKSLGNTTAEENADGMKIYSTIVYPGETELFMEGKYDGYKSNISAKPLSAEYRENVWKISAASIDKERETMIRVAGTYTNYEEAVTRAVEAQVPFIDLEFPPSQKILCRHEIDMNKVPVMPLSRFRNIAEAMGTPSPFPLCKLDDMNFTKVIEGSLGDFWLICAATCLTEYPDVLRRIFQSLKTEEMDDEENIGCYRVNMNINGWWENIIIDDYLPSMAQRLTFARLSHPAVFWLSALEKAYAKAHGSYAAIISGDGLMALQDFTGFPITRFDRDWEEALKDSIAEKEFLSIIEDYLKSKFLVVLNTPGYDTMGYNLLEARTRKETEVIYEAAGLKTAHMYVLLHLKTFPEENISLLQIRNPWGKGVEWKGPWGAEDSKWNQYPQIKEELKENCQSEGNTFWMSWQDVKMYFDGGGVLFNKLSWYDYRIRGVFVGHVPSFVLEINVMEPCSMMLILSQKDRHGLARTDPNNTYSAIMLSVSWQSGNKQAVHLNSSTSTACPTEAYTFNFSRDHSLMYTFEPKHNPYLVIPRIYPTAAGISHASTSEKKFVLGILSESPVGSSYKASFKQLPSDCKVFDNYPKFIYSSENIEGVECEHQFSTLYDMPVVSKSRALEMRS